MKFFRQFFPLAFVLVLFTNFSNGNLQDNSGANSSHSTQNQPSHKFKLAYTTSYDAKEIIPLDLETGKSGIAIQLEHHPKSIAVQSDSQIAYVLCEGSNDIIPVDLITGKSGEPFVQEIIPLSVAVSPTEKKAYISYEDSQLVNVMNLTTGSTSLLVSLEKTPLQMSLTPDGKALYIFYENSNEITSIDLQSSQIRAPIFLHEIPKALTITSNGQMVSIAEYPKAMSFYDLKTGSFTGQVTIGNQTDQLERKIQNLYLSPDNTIAYLTQENSNEIISVDLATHSTSAFAIDHKIKNIAIYQKQELIAEFVKSIAPAGHASYFDASKTKPFSGAIVDYLWSFGDGNKTSSASPLITHIYQHADQFDVTLTVKEAVKNFPVNDAHSDAEGLLSASATVSISVPKKLTSQKIGGPIVLIGGTSTSFSSSAEPSVFGESITFSSTVSGLVGPGIPTGTIDFVDTVLGTIGTGVLDVNGTATHTTSALAVGSYSLSANYSGDINFDPSSSSPPQFIQDVNQALTTTTVSGTPNPSVFGNSVTLTAIIAVVAPGAGTPTGTVTFYDGVSVIGTSSLVGLQATIATSILTPGPHNITAVYNGNGSFLTSTSPGWTQTVTRGTTSTSLVTSLTPSPFGSSLTFTATVSVATGAGTPTGTVTFRDGLITLGTQPLAGGTATFSTSLLAVGTHNIVANYNGDGNFTLSISNTIIQVISQATTAIVLTSSVNPSTYGQSTTFTANVSVTTGAGTPTGTVTFFDGVTSLGTSTLSGGGVATLPIFDLTVATHSITAVYNGDTNFSTSISAPLSQVVNKATPTNVVSSSLNPSNFGASVTFTATVSAPTTLGLPSGTVDFYNGVTFIGTGTLSGISANTATATFTITTLNAGSLPITAQYSGDGNFNAVTSPVINQVVNPVGSTQIIVFSNSQNPSNFGQNVILRATVTGTTASPPFPPTGSITFFDGVTPIGTTPVVLVPGNPNSGTTFLSVSTLTTGVHIITAQYSGDVNYPASPVSAPMTQNVIQTSTTSSVTTSGTPSVFGQNVTFAVTVNSVAPGMGAPTGTVSFYDGATFLGTSTPLVPGVNSSTAGFTTNSLSLGSHIISGIYSGDTNFTSSSAPTITQVVNQDPTNTLIISSSSSPPGFNFGNFITFTATVTAAAPGSGTPTGTVRFFQGATLLATGTLSGGVATGTTVVLYPTPPLHSITAIYSGDTNFIASTSPPFSQAIGSTLPTTTNVSSSRNSSPGGAAVTYSARVVANPGPGQGIPGIPTGTVTFTDTTLGLVLGTSTLNAFGIATITEAGANLPFIPPAPDIHLIQATYNGQTAVFNPSTSALFTQYVVPLDTTTTLVAIPNQSTQGGSTLVASVGVVGGVPPFPTVGTVTFFQGTTNLGTVPIAPDGTATLMPNNLLFGSGTIIAIYSGDTLQFAMSISNPVSLQVQQTEMLTTSTTITSSMSSSIACQPVTFSALVVATQGFYIPTGTVTFFSDNVSIGTGILDNTGRTTLTTSSLPVGTHAINATYNSDSNYAFSFGNTIIQTVAANNTSLAFSIIPSLASTPYGQSIILSAVVSSTSPYLAIATGSVTFSEGLNEIATVDLDATGRATYQIPNLDVGSYTVVATYNPDPCFQTSTASQLHLIVKINPQTTFTTTPNPSIYGDTITLTATVSSAVGSPTGTITFFNGAIPIGTVFLEGGAASIDLASPLAGFAILSARYSGDTNFLPITTASVSQTINKAPTATCLVSFTTNPSEYGESVSLVATVSSAVSGITPGITGSVTFTNGSILLGTVSLNGCDTADLETSNLNLGSGNNIVANYTGDANFAASTSSVQNRTVIQASTNTTVTSITSTPSPPTFGTLATFNVAVEAVSPGSGIPTGTVTGFYGSTSLGTSTLVNGVASFSTSVLPAGVQTIIVKYSGDTNFTLSQRATTLTVLRAVTTSTITSSANPSVIGQPVTYNVTIISSQGIPTGTVAFLDGTTTLSTETLNGAGIASFTTSGLTIGTHPIRAVYSGSTNLATSSTAILNQVVNKGSTTTTLKSTPNPSLYGATTTFVATVAPISPGNGLPTGTITFVNGAVTIGTGILNVNGQTTLEISTSLAASLTPYSLTAVYSGDSNFNTSTGALSQTISKAPTKINATYTPNPAAFGQPVTINATVIATNGLGIPSGTVTATYGSQIVGSGTLSGTGTVSILTTNLPAGTLGIILHYLGDTNFLSSTIPLTQTVTPATSTTALSSSSNPSMFNTPVTFTASVSSASPTIVPTGIVTYFDGATILGTQALNAFGFTTLTTSELSVGTHLITAVYSGGGSNAPSTSTVLSQVVNIGTSTTTVSSILNPSVYGETVTLSALVTTVPVNGIPTGTVTFKNGAATIGVVTLNNNGAALLSLSTLPVGVNSITAVYNGSTSYATSTSAILSQVVARAPTIASVTSALNPAPFGTAVPISGTITPLNNGSTTLPSGTIVTAFYGSTSVGSGVLNASGQYLFNVTGLPAGTNAIEVRYPGDANFLTSTITLTQTVSAIVSSITIASSPNPSAFGQIVTITNVVTLASGTATGTVTYYDGANAIGTTVPGQPLLISTLTPGTHPITAVYTGPAGTASSTSNMVNQVVNAEGTTTALTSVLNPSVFGETVTFTAVVGSVTTISGAPTGTVTFRNGAATIGVVTLNNNSTATLSLSSLTVGTNAITAVYSGNTNYTSSTSAIVNQIVAKTPTIASVVSATNPVAFGTSVPISGTITPLNNGSTTLPSGTTVTAFYGATPVGSGTINASGQYSFSITGLPTGTVGIEIKYPGDTNFVNSSITLTQTITADASTIVIGSSPNPSVFGQAVTITNAVTLTSGGIAAGTVTYFDGASAIGTTNVGQSLVISTLTPGTHQITAVYSGSTSAITSTSNTVNQMVNQGVSSTTIVSSLNPSIYGTNVTFNANVTSPTGTPTGFVTFNNGASVIGTAALNPAGSASLTLSTLPVGPNPITAIYSGSANFAASTSSLLTQVVNKVPAAGTTTTIVTGVPNPSVFGQDVNFFANVSSPNGNPTGTVTYFDGATALSTVPLLDGLAVLSINSLSPGGHSITAVYNGDANFNASLPSGIYIQVVDPVTTTITTVTTLTSSLNPSTFGDPVTFNVQITSAAIPPPYPTGFVTLYSGSVPLVTLPLNGTGGASYTTSALPAENLQIVALYSGDMAFSASTDVILQVVNAISTTTNLTSSVNPSTFGEQVTFTAIVASGAGNPTPTGTVSFYGGATLIQTVILNGAGVANFVTSTLTTGSHTINAVYNQDPSFGSSNSSVIQVVGTGITVTTILSSSSNPSFTGGSVTFIANTTSVSGNPTGLVTFYDGATPIGSSPLSNGLAFFSTAGLATGSHSITAVYGGDANYAPSVSTPYIQQVINASTILQPPRGFCGCPVVSVFLNKTYRANVLNWSAPGTGAEPEFYKIYRDAGLTDLVAVIPACGRLTYTDRKRRNDENQTYYLVASNQSGISSYVTVTVGPQSATCSSLKKDYR